MPSPAFVELIDGFEVFFREVHHDELDYETRGVLKAMRKRIEEAFPNSPPRLIKTYCTGRYVWVRKKLCHRQTMFFHL